MISSQMGLAVPFIISLAFAEACGVLRRDRARAPINAATLGALKLFGAGCYLIHTGLKPEAHR
jgi:hypothetical protein